jgi:uncharacterized repeat protein (TIGR03837 family)
MTSPDRPAWDIFCRVVDNFGDIGVCWRFARQLAHEHDLAVRLWVDDLVTFQRINAEIDPESAAQSSGGVEIRHWIEPFPDASPADVVVETFGCDTPERYQLAMAAMEKKPVWINFEYLSAEPWVNDCHALPSPHPRLPLVKYYFFPGFGPEVGGLLRERDLMRERELFISESKTVAAFWRSLKLSPPAPTETRVSLFCYENPAIADLFTAWTASPAPLLCLVPDGRAIAEVKAFFTADESIAPNDYARGNLKVRVLPFLEQSQYDRLLWVCDCNIVRGEDSFVRAQWAGKPFVWHIYPQQENAHWVKLNAFIDQYCSDMEPETAADLRAFWRTWNSGRGAGQAWPAFWRRRAELAAHADRWAERLVGLGDLVSNMVRFADKLLSESDAASGLR